ncbi:MAG: NUDIX hydrolase, partial [Limnohabitans sp.]|nr:NUDIX hydrolase [Limnohabitans sp.]
MSDDHLIEHRVHQEELLRGRFLHAFRDTVRLPNQNLATREYVVHPGAVMVIPMLDTPDGLRLVMERQFRYPVGQVMTEFPAGKLDPGEDP